MSEVAIDQEKILERHLLKLTDFGDSDVRQECIVQIDVGEIFSWIVKFRKSGIIVNNRDMICSSFIELDATISFKTIRDFFGATAPSGKCDVIKTESEFVYKYMGDENVLQYVWAKLLGIGMSSHVMSHLCMKSIHDESSSKNSNNALNSRHNTPRLETRGSSSSHLNSSSGYSSGEAQYHQSPKVLKCGTLWKKKDILTGWQSRFFVLQLGRLSYYIDETAYKADANPRGILLLSGADISPVKLCVVNGTDRHAIAVEPKLKGKSIKLCSELNGAQGKDEIMAWEAEFQKAAASTYSHNSRNSIRSSVGNFGSNSTLSQLQLPITSPKYANNNNNNNGNYSQTNSSFSTPFESQANSVSKSFQKNRKNNNQVLRNNGNKNSDHHVWEETKTSNAKQRFPGDIEDKENEDEINMKKNGHERINYLYFGCAFFCCLIGLITNGWLGAVWSAALIFSVYQILPP